MGPNGPANFADIGTSLFNPFVFWFADFYNKPEYAWHQGQLIEPGRTHKITYKYFLYYKPGMLEVAPQELDAYYSEAETVSMRSSWGDEQAIYLIGKGVDDRLQSHVDLDSGTFELDALGVRWATEVGAESYGLPGFWDYNYRRWTYYRKRPEGQLLDVQLGINGVEKAVYAQDLVMEYDKEKFELIGFTEEEPNIVVQSEEIEQGLSVILANTEGIKTSSQLL